MKQPRYLLDSTVLIDALRLRVEAVEFLNRSRTRPFLPTMVMAEVYSGIREGRKRLAMERWVSLCRIVPVSANLAREGGLLARQFRRSHGTCLADAIIAATAKFLDATLVTGNGRHFPMITNLLKPY